MGAYQYCTWCGEGMDQGSARERYRRECNCPHCHKNTSTIDGPEDLIVDMEDRIRELEEAVAKLSAPSVPSIVLNASEVQSNHDRVKWAEGLILQLPNKHEGRNSWLLNNGRGEEATAMRNVRGIKWDDATQSAELAD